MCPALLYHGLELHVVLRTPRNIERSHEGIGCMVHNLSGTNYFPCREWAIIKELRPVFNLPSFCFIKRAVTQKDMRRLGDVSPVGWLYWIGDLIPQYDKRGGRNQQSWIITILQGASLSSARESWQNSRNIPGETLLCRIASSSHTQQYKNIGRMRNRVAHRRKKCGVCYKRDSKRVSLLGNRLII